MKPAAWYAVLLGSLCATGCHAPASPSASNAADVEAVRQTDDNWSKAAQSKKVEDWMAFYADDVIVLPPNDRKTEGKQNAGRAIGALLATPGLSISWQPQKVEVAQSGDLAYTQGAYTLTANDAYGHPQADHGKTAEIWKKQADGSWKCIVDMWNSDLPLPPV